MVPQPGPDGGYPGQVQMGVPEVGYPLAGMGYPQPGQDRGGIQGGVPTNLSRDGVPPGLVRMGVPKYGVLHPLAWSGQGVPEVG